MAMLYPTIGDNITHNTTFVYTFCNHLTSIVTGINIAIRIHITCNTACTFYAVDSTTVLGITHITSVIKEAGQTTRGFSITCNRGKVLTLPDSRTRVQITGQTTHIVPICSKGTSNRTAIGTFGEVGTVEHSTYNTAHFNGAGGDITFHIQAVDMGAVDHAKETGILLGSIHIQTRDREVVTRQGSLERFGIGTDGSPAGARNRGHVNIGSKNHRQSHETCMRAETFIDGTVVDGIAEVDQILQTVNRQFRNIVTREIGQHQFAAYAIQGGRKSVHQRHTARKFFDMNLSGGADGNSSHMAVPFNGIASGSRSHCKVFLDGIAEIGHIIFHTEQYGSSSQDNCRQRINAFWTRIKTIGEDPMFRIIAFQTGIHERRA